MDPQKRRNAVSIYMDLVENDVDALMKQPTTKTKF